MTLLRLGWSSVTLLRCGPRAEPYPAPLPVDPVTGELLGNFPQAFSHIGLVNAAWAIDQAERTAEGGPSG